MRAKALHELKFVIAPPYLSSCARQDGARIEDVGPAIAANGRPRETLAEPNRGEANVGEARDAARRIPEDA